MMILRSSPASPFARKVRIALDLVGLASRVTVMDADTGDEADPLRRENPLGKVPTLVLDDGTAVFDSRVILDHLDALTGGGTLIPVDPAARLRCLTTQALADGVMDASVLIVYEARWRPEAIRLPRWTDHQGDKIARALGVLEAVPPEDGADAGAVAVACALGYLDLRLGGAWRARHPALVAWLDRFAVAVPAFEATRFIPPA